MYLKNAKKSFFLVNKAIFNQTKILLNIIIFIYSTGKRGNYLLFPLFHSTTKDIRNEGETRVLFEHN